jgi:RsiW-degrading membrane proteinase PrsW (M82 family)
MFFNYFRNKIESEGVIMKKVYIYLFVGIIAIVLMTVWVFIFQDDKEQETKKS